MPWELGHYASVNLSEKIMSHSTGHIQYASQAYSRRTRTKERSGAKSKCLRSHHNVSWTGIYSSKDLSRVETSQRTQCFRNRLARPQNLGSPSRRAGLYPILCHNRFRHLLLGRVQDQLCWDYEQVEFTSQKVELQAHRIREMVSRQCNTFWQARNLAKTI